MSEMDPTGASQAGSTLPDGDTALRPERLGATAGLDRTGGELRPERLGAPLRPERLGALARELPGWSLDDGRTLERTFHWPDRAAAVAFAALAATAGDAFAAAPEIHLAGNAVSVRFTARGGALTEGQAEAARALDGRWGGPAVG
jgi:pterin-4a-carbinolamine dehydratase